MPHPSFVLKDHRISAADATTLPTVDSAPNLLQGYPGARLHHCSHRETRQSADHLLTWGCFYRAVHECFALHLPLALDPAVLWYLITHEVATAVRHAPDGWATRFTHHPNERQVVRVRDDSLVYGQENDWARTIGGFYDALTPLVPADAVDRLLVDFSTTTVTSRVATLVSVMDAASPYFEFRCTTLCGIPALRMDGTVEDWTRLVECTRAVADWIPDGDAGGPLHVYFRHLIPVLERLARARAGHRDVDLVRSLYKMNNESGGPYVTGWISAFTAFINWGGEIREKPAHLFDVGRRKQVRGLSPGISHNELPSHQSSVSFVWEYLDREIPMALQSGILCAEVDDGFVSPRLGFAVVEPALASP